MKNRFQIDRDVDARLQAYTTAMTANGGEGPGRAASIVVTSSGGEAGGEAFAAVLGERIGFAAWDRPLLEAVAAEPGRRAQILDGLDDEQRRGVADAMARVAAGAGEAARGLLDIAAALAVRGRAILLDAGGHRLLPESSVLRVRLEAPLEKAIPHVAARQGLELEAARRLVEERGNATAAFELEAFGAGGPEVGAHDLMINSSTLDLFSAVELVVTAFEAKHHPELGWWRQP